MDRIACVDLPEFPLQLLLRRHPEWHSLPVVVVDRDKAQGVILHVNDRARRMRILPGMRYAAGLSLCTKLRAGEVPESEIADHITTIAHQLRFFSADVEPSENEPGVFWLDASGLSLLYPSLRKWANLMRDDLAKKGFSSTVAAGFSRFGSYAVARTAPETTIFTSIDEERARVQEIRIDRLGFDPALRDTLDKLGITTVGGFLSLPENGIRKRFGSDVHRLYRLAKGELFSPLVPQPPQEPVFASVHLDHPEVNLDRIMVVIDRHLQSLVRRLTERSEVLATIHVRLTFDNGERTAERLQPATPTLDLTRITELVRLRLGSISFPCGVCDIDVEVDGMPAHQKQAELFVEKSPRDLNAVARAFARLRAEFGNGAVVRAALRDAQLPEARFEWEPIDAVEAPRPRNVRFPPLVRRLYAKPVVFSPGKQRGADRQLTVHIDDGSIRETQGPYIVSGGWWAREVHREYYFVRAASGRCLWLYYDRRRTCWFMHGEVE